MCDEESPGVFYYVVEGTVPSNRSEDSACTKLSEHDSLRLHSLEKTQTLFEQIAAFGDFALRGQMVHDRRKQLRQ